MPYFPQGPNAPLVTSAVFTQPTASKTLVNGEFAIVSPAASVTLTLPTIAGTDAAPNGPVGGAQGPIAVKNLTGAHTVTIVTADDSTIDGITGSTGIPLAKAFDTVTLVSDGTNWWTVSSNLETNETPV